MCARHFKEQPVPERYEPNTAEIEAVLAAPMSALSRGGATDPARPVDPEATVAADPEATVYAPPSPEELAEMAAAPSAAPVPIAIPSAPPEQDPLMELPAEPEIVYPELPEEEPAEEPLPATEVVPVLPAPVGATRTIEAPAQTDYAPEPLTLDEPRHKADKLLVFLAVLVALAIVGVIAFMMFGGQLGETLGLDGRPRAKSSEREVVEQLVEPEAAPEASASATPGATAAEATADASANTAETDAADAAAEPATDDSAAPEADTSEETTDATASEAASESTEAA